MRASPGHYLHQHTTYILSTNYLHTIQDTPNVIGVMVLNNEGFPIKSNLDNTTTVQYGHMIADLAEKVGHILETFVMLYFTVYCLIILLSSPGQVDSPRPGPDQRPDLPPAEVRQPRGVGGARG